MLRPALLKFLLVFALLFTQQGAVLHAYTHTLAEQTQDRTLPHDKQCNLCAAYAQIGSAIGVGHIHFDFLAFFAAEATTHSTAFYFIAFTAFAARAPPCFA